MRTLHSSKAKQRRVRMLTGPPREQALFAGDGGPLHRAIEWALRKARVNPIHGGTSEVIREMVAERCLGLPRNRPVG